MRVFIILLYFIVVLMACAAPARIIKYEEQKNEFYTNNSLRDFLKINNSPKIVLRVSNLDASSGTRGSPEKRLIYLYNIMENELIKMGYSVKDRSTFNEIISKTNSSELLKKELSDADLILEVVSIDDKVEYTTNTVLSIKRKVINQTKQPIQYRSLGAFVEYRLIVVHNNEIGGTYKFFYQPCAHGCAVGDFKLTGKAKDKEVQLTKFIPNEIIEKFVSTSVQELVYFLQVSGKGTASN